MSDQHKIVSLNDFRNTKHPSSTTEQEEIVCCEEMGLVFPQIYRLRGYEPIEDDFIAGHPLNERAEIPPRYTFEIDAHYLEEMKIIAPEWRKITRLDPKVDTGVLIVRHHYRLEDAIQYLEGIRDACNSHAPMHWDCHETDQGIFTLVHRPSNLGCPDCLILYTVLMLDTEFGLRDWYKIIGPDGEEEMDVTKILQPIN